MLKKTYSISDLEGFYPKFILPMYDEIKSNHATHELIICGDIMDSTLKTTPDLTLKTTPDPYPNILKLKSNNIKTIYDIVTNQNIFLTFGNRDLNKIKVGPLTELYYGVKNEENKELVSKFNSGNLEKLDIETYNKLSKLSALGGWCQKMSNWYPFWSVSKGNSYWKSEAEPFEKKNKDGKIKKYGFFERRFYKIFGSDPLLGTMGADKLLQTIPMELGLYEESLPDYNAFVVLAVFKSMLQKVSFTDKESKLHKILHPTVYTDASVATSVSSPVISQSIFKGLLYTLFTDEKNNMIIMRTDCANTYLFSHGGVNSEIIERNTLEELDLILNNPKSAEFREKITDAKQIGGYYKNTTVYNDQVFNESIINFNSKMKEVLNRIFEENYKELNKPSSNILFVLLATLSSNCQSIYSKMFSKVEAIVKCKELGILNSSFRSTMAGIKELRSKNKIFYHRTNGAKLFNIFGHNPNGFGPTVDLFENGTNKTYLVNLDNSNTFLSSPLNRSLYNHELSTSTYILIEDNSLKLKTKIFIQTKAEEQIQIDDNNDPLFKYFMSNATDDEKNKIVLAYTGDTPSNNVDINIEDIIDDDMDKNLKLFGDNEHIFYHGMHEDKLIFNYRRVLEAPFPRCLFIIDINIFKKRYIYRNFQKKYLKYKQKYINLKKLL
jgi:hypothetical protein